MMRPYGEPLVQIRHLKKYFSIAQGIFSGRSTQRLKALDDVSFDIHKSETLGLVGESGCGKSTCALTMLRFYDPTGGRILFKGIDLTNLRGKNLRQMRHHMQMIAQDPLDSLDPRMTVGASIAEPLEAHDPMSTRAKRDRIQELLQMVGLRISDANRYPHEFSGGQRQRVGIARALALNPDLIICDEPISALDVSIQAQIVNLLEDLQDRLELTYLFISHDLRMVRHISDRIAVMYLGKIIELAGRDEIYQNPLHPYTQALISAVPVPDPDVERTREKIVLEGDLPSPANPPEGCNFSTRCPFAESICFKIEPSYVEVALDHWAACHLVEPSSEVKRADVT